MAPLGGARLNCRARRYLCGRTGMAICSATSSVRGVHVLAIASVLLLGSSVALDLPGKLFDTMPSNRKSNPAEELGVLASHGTSPGGEICSLAVSPDGTLLATGARDGTVQLWEASELLPLARWQTHRQKVTALAFSPDSHFLLTSGADQTITRWAIKETAVPQLSGHWRSDGPVTALAVAPDGRTVAIACVDCLGFLDTERSDLDSKRKLCIPGSPIRALAFAPDGKVLAGGGGGENAVRVWDLVAGQLVTRHTLDGHADSWVRGLAFTVDGATLVSLDTGGRLLAWNGCGHLCGEYYVGQPSCLFASLGAGGRLVLTKAVAESSARLLRLPDGWWR